jgi:16S rRNA (uracil1498-N3)-methyltransferase
MTRRRWIADEVSDNCAVLTGDHADHLVRVMRARVGQQFDVVAGAVVRQGRIIRITPSRVEFELGEETEPKPAAQITILLAIFKFDRMEWAIEKCTELGVSRIIPVIAGRTDSHLASAAAKRTERWRKIALQAAEQARRATVPTIESPEKLRDAIARPGALRVVLDECEEQTHLRDAIHPTEGEIFLAIGPEGGWTQDELQLFHQAGWISASLGSTILRAETAAIAAVAITISVV